jgi:hypothetical protein
LLATIPIYRSDCADVLAGFNGDDAIFGFGGDDRMYGGAAMTSSAAAKQ